MLPVKNAHPCFAPMAKTGTAVRDRVASAGLLLTPGPSHGGNVPTDIPSPGTLNPSTAHGILIPSHTREPCEHNRTWPHYQITAEGDQYNPQDRSVLLPPLHGLMGGLDLEPHGDLQGQSIIGTLFYSNVFLRAMFGNIFTSDCICYLATCIGYSIHKDKFLLASWHEFKICLWTQQCGKRFKTGPSSILLEQSLWLQGKPNGRHFI